MSCPVAVRALIGASLLAFLAAGALAQNPKTPPRRITPNVSETSRIPAGVDTGSPTTSTNLPLGTPVPPAPGVDRSDLRTRSAAARAAARPKPPAPEASSPAGPVSAGPPAPAECPAPEVTAFRRSMSECTAIADRAARAACAERVMAARSGAAPGAAVAPGPGGPSAILRPGCL